MTEDKEIKKFLVKYSVVEKNWKNPRIKFTSLMVDAYTEGEAKWMIEEIYTNERVSKFWKIKEITEARSVGK